MTNEEPYSTSVFAYFGDTSDSAIEEVLALTFDLPFKRVENSWIVLGQKNFEYSIHQHPNGWAKFLELFRGSAEELARVSEEHALYLTDEDWAEQGPETFTHWLDFRLSVPTIMKFMDGYPDVNALKNNYLTTNDGIAYDFDSVEATVLHPCGDGIWGDYLF